MLKSVKKVQFMETKIFCVYIIGKNLDNICHIYVLTLPKQKLILLKNFSQRFFFDNEIFVYLSLLTMYKYLPTNREKTQTF